MKIVTCTETGLDADLLPGMQAQQLRLQFTPTTGGVLVAHIRIDGESVGDLDFLLCRLCGVGIIEQIRIDSSQRRRGYARRAVQALLSKAGGCTWTVTPIADTAAARALWRSVGLYATTPISYCRHMRTNRRH